MKLLIVFLLVSLLIVFGINSFILKDSSKLPSLPSISKKVVKVDKELNVAAAGDISCDSLIPEDSACRQEATANLIEKIDPVFVLALGDLQYETGTLDNFNNFYDKSWGLFKDETKPAIGNHDYANAAASGYFDYFNGQNQLNGLAGERGKGYYTFEKDGWKFFALNSNCSEIRGCSANSNQGKWLEQELSKNPAKCQIAYFHHPLFSSGPHGTNSKVLPLWQILYRYNVDIVLNGHDHIYERFALQDPSGKQDPEKGIRQFTVGTGGRNLYEIKEITPNSEVRISDKFGLLKLTLKEQDYSWQFISIDNQILDSGTSPCR